MQKIKLTMGTNPHKLIIEYMGAEVDGDIVQTNDVGINEQLLAGYNVALARYDCSWDWLVPVISKLLKEPKQLLGESSSELRSLGFETRIEEAYDVVVECIKTLNKNVR